MNRILFRLFLCCLLFASATTLAKGQDAKVREATELKYKVGQKWGYQARAGEENSYFVVVKIESDPKLGNIIHIAVRGLKMKNLRSPGGISENVNHMPFSEGAVDKSAVKLLKRKTDLPNFEEGYQMW
jgi:hypothetical protein